MSDESTRRIEIELPASQGPDLACPNRTNDPWALDSPSRLFAPLRPRPPVDPGSVRSAAANTSNDPATLNQNAPDISDLQPIAPRRPVLGKRGFLPTYQWEGVVEEVNGETFRARLLPFEHGQPDTSRVEYTDFEYEDLADGCDYSRVIEGAIFTGPWVKAVTLRGPSRTLHCCDFGGSRVPRRFKRVKQPRKRERYSTTLGATDRPKCTCARRDRDFGVWAWLWRGNLRSRGWSMDAR